MKSYHVVINEKAREDLKELSRVIREEYKSPLTAVRY
jgi:mRNA-degrading endonuclease RelE of RelBE toxin-antitoxin system